MYFERTFRVGARDVDPFGQCRPSSMMSFLQEAATSAAVALGVSREEMIRRYNVFWMVARIWYQLDKPVRWDEEITIRTWHRANKGASMYRDFDLYRDGERIGEAVSVWVLADLDTHKLFRLGDVSEFEGTGGGERPLHYSDADVNGHVNNTRYSDFACDALHMQRLGNGNFVSSLQIGYLKECRPGETIRLSTGYGDGVWYVQGDGAEGKARFDAALTLTPLDDPPPGA